MKKSYEIKGSRKMPSIRVAKCYKPLFENDYKDFALPGGRNSGKSKTSAILQGLHSAIKPNEDIVIARASYGSIGDSVFNETQEVLESIPAFENQFIYRKSPYRIIRACNNSTIYFMGVGGSTNRTKGFHPLHKVGLVILEEAQELKSREHLEQTMATLRRRFGEDCKVVVVFNPPAQELHWINVWCEEKKKDKDWCVIHSTYEDILPFLNDRDIKEIRKMYHENRQFHDYMYGGIPTGGFGAVYPMFRKDKHIITKQEYDYVIANSEIRPVACIIGGDGAVNRDSTSFVPLIVMSNGQIVVGSIFHHDPKKDGQFGYHQLVRDFVNRWLDNICAEFHLGTRQEIMMAQERGMNITVLPIYVRVDNAAADLIQECKFFMGDRCDVGAIKKGTIPEMVGTVQSALCGDNIVIIDYKGHYNYVKNQFEPRDINYLAEELSMLIWNEKQDNYDPIVPNDDSDAFTYACRFWYENIENISWFDILKANCISTKMIYDIIKR